MELSVNLGYARKMRGTEQKRAIKDAAQMVKAAGFNYVDAGVAGLVQEDNWQEIFKQAKFDIESAGLKINQTHAPFNFTYFTADEYKELMKRSFEASHILGAEHIIIHADNYLPDEKGFNPDNALKEICEFYAPNVEYAKKVGLKVAVENLFEGKPIDTYVTSERTRYTSSVEEQLAVIEYFNDPIVTACWDFGHGQVSYRYNYMEGFKKIGKYLTSTHVHDNIWGFDLHNIPFHGDIPWEDVMAFMKEINYNGKFTMEMVYGNLPDALLPNHLKLWYDTGKYLVNL